MHLTSRWQGWGLCIVDDTFWKMLLPRSHTQITITFMKAGSSHLWTLKSSIHSPRCPTQWRHEQWCGITRSTQACTPVANKQFLSAHIDTPGDMFALMYSIYEVSLICHVEQSKEFSKMVTQTLKGLQLKLSLKLDKKSLCASPWYLLVQDSFIRQNFISAYASI